MSGTGYTVTGAILSSACKPVGGWVAARVAVQHLQRVSTLVLNTGRAAPR